MSIVEVRVPEIGDAKGVNVVDVLIKKGSEIRIDDPLITLESEKASMDVPSPVSGIVDSVEIKKGDEVSAGALIATVRVVEAAAAAATAAAATAAASTQAPSSAAGTATAAPTAAATAASAPATAPPAAAQAAEAPAGAVDLVVLGAGVGGYTAAFRAADLGLKVMLIERWPVLGRRVLERRLYPVQGAAPCGQGDRGCGGHGVPAASCSARRKSIATACVPGRTVSSPD